MMEEWILDYRIFNLDQEQFTQPISKQDIRIQ